MTDYAVEIRCLGNFSAQGLAEDLRGAKHIALLAFLASNLDAPMSRETLISIFWGDRFNDQARQSLRQALSVLRRAFRPCPEALEIERNTVRLNPALVIVDIKKAEAAIANGNGEKAVEIFRRGDFLASLYPKESAILEWLTLERARWRELARKTMIDHGETLLLNSHATPAEEIADWLLRQDPLDEASAQLAMRSKAASGSVSAVAEIYRRLCKNLMAELGVEPASETTQCFNRLLYGKSVGQPAANGAAADATPDREAASDVPLISVEHFDFAPDNAATRALAADVRSQLIFRLIKRTGIKVLDEYPGQQDISTYELKGRLRTSGNQGRLNLSMILREQSRTVFSQNYTGDLSDTLKFCDDLVAQAETNIRVHTNAFDGERLSNIPESKLGVRELQSKAANLLHTGTVEGFGHANRLMDRAVALDATDPTSLAMRANIRIWLSMAGCGQLSVFEQERLETDLNTALERQNSSDYIYHVRGTFYACCKRDAAATLKDGERALEINPNYALAFNTLGLGHLLSGQYDEAVSSLKRYVALSENDPLLPARLFPLAIAQYCSGDYPGAEATIDRAIGLKPNHRLFHRLRSMCLRANGKNDDANLAEDVADRLPDTPSVLAVCPPIHQSKSDHLLKTLK
ncbi:BTAD domain-containing putative transcriptional regulator [Hoeflea sp.]|uniref:BTAD domain-containing putative transcriptional regulator n=1 Tax=Hoeflea sp. TaxID=1940281 RepID=UPI003B01D207